jgi:N-acetylglutamate synthase-like GNAT family acetyltransferase
MAMAIRRATEADQQAVTAMVRGARLNPRNLHWQRFVVAEHDGVIIGTAQLRLHPDGVRELASLVVEPGMRDQGVASRLVDALLTGDEEEDYMLVDRRFAHHYERWGFRQVNTRDLPRSLARQYRIGRVVTAVASVVLRRRIRLVPLKR